jgi:hypothetical protein
MNQGRSWISCCVCAAFWLASSTGTSKASDLGIETAFQITRLNKLCSHLPGAVLLGKPDHLLVQTVQTCTVRNGVIKTGRGLRLLIINSQTDARGRPDLHGIWWVDLDCNELTKRDANGFYYFSSPRVMAASPGTQIFSVRNGWSIRQKPVRLGDWKTLKQDFSDAAMIKACRLFQ